MVSHPTAVVTYAITDAIQDSKFIMECTASDEGSRCFFLELPTEIRHMIYDEVVPLGGYTIFVGKHSDKPLGSLVKIIPLTQVSRQVREQSLPSVYGKASLEFWTFFGKYRKAVRFWAERVATSGVLAHITKCTFEPLRECYGSIVIDLTRLEGPLTDMTHGACRGIFKSACNMVEALAHDTEAKIQVLRELQVIETERRIMTKEMMQSILESICKLSEEYNKPKPESEEETSSGWIECSTESTLRPCEGDE